VCVLGPVSFAQIYLFPLFFRLLFFPLVLLFFPFTTYSLFLFFTFSFVLVSFFCSVFSFVFLHLPLSFCIFLSSLSYVLLYVLHFIFLPSFYPDLFLSFSCFLYPFIFISLLGAPLCVFTIQCWQQILKEIKTQVSSSSK
jgi:hypothetical protein